MTTPNVTPRWSHLLSGIVLLSSAFALPVSAQMTIPVNGGGTISSSGAGAIQNFTFTVPAGTANIADLNVRLSIDYPALQELAITLTSPQNTSLLLLQNATASGANLQDTVLDDSGIGPIGTTGFTTAPFAGPGWAGSSYQPQYYGGGSIYHFSKFAGENPQGTWTLQIIGYQLNPPTLNSGQLYASGGGASWGSAIGTALILTPVPEPQQYAVIFGSLLVMGTAVRRFFS